MLIQLSAAQFLEFLLQENSESFTTLKPFFITHDAMWVANELIYKNPSDIASYFSQVSSREYLPKSVRKHTNDCVETHTDVAFFVPTAEAMTLTVLLHVV
jgi:hypothetical protein